MVLYVQVWRTHARLLLLRSLAMIWEQATVLPTWSGRLVFCLFVGLYVPPTSRHFSCCFHSHVQKLSGPTKTHAQRNLTKTILISRDFLSGSENMKKTHDFSLTPERRLPGTIYFWMVLTIKKSLQSSPIWCFRCQHGLGVDCHACFSIRIDSQEFLSIETDQWPGDEVIPTKFLWSN